MAQPERTKLGTRGYHAQIKEGAVDIRLHQRDFTDHEKLHATWRGATLDRDEWFDLVAAAPTITSCIQTYERDQVEPSLFIPLGRKGFHAMVNIYNDTLLVQLRIYSRSFYDPDKLFPTKQGVALKRDEWHELAENIKKLSSQLVA